MSISGISSQPMDEKKSQNGNKYSKSIGNTYEATMMNLDIQTDPNYWVVGLQIILNYRPYHNHYIKLPKQRFIFTTLPPPSPYMDCGHNKAFVNKLTWFVSGGMVALPFLPPPIIFIAIFIIRKIT